MHKGMAATLATVATAALAMAAPATSSAGEVAQTNLGSANGLNYREAGPMVLGPDAETFIFADDGNLMVVKLTGTAGASTNRLAAMRCVLRVALAAAPRG